MNYNCKLLLFNIIQIHIKVVWRFMTGMVTYHFRLACTELQKLGEISAQTHTILYMHHCNTKPVPKTNSLSHKMHV